MNKHNILTFISLQHEGSYWDFKKQWHESKEDLLHDIICMANNLENRDAYIIIGVDEENNFKIHDVCNDPNRKNTQNLVDFLKDKKFAGGIRPSVHIENIEFNNNVIDVIVIENSDKTPFYLTEKFQQLRANHIYTRIQDTNTPKDRSADINNIEYLWKKRFHMINTPIEKFGFYLQDKDNWEQSSDENHMYYKLYPEYLIEFEEDNRDGYEYYFFTQTDSRPHWGKIRLKYMNTSLFETNGIGLDGFRYMTAVPNIGFLDIKNHVHSGNSIHYSYLVKTSLEYSIHYFYYRYPYNDQWAYQAFISSILIFENEIEHKDFKCYAEQNWFNTKYEAKEEMLPHIPQIENLVMDYYKEEWEDFLKLNYLLQKFRENC